MALFRLVHMLNPKVYAELLFDMYNQFLFFSIYGLVYYSHTVMWENCIGGTVSILEDKYGLMILY